MVAPNTPADTSRARPEQPAQPVFVLPDLGEGLEEAELIEWCVHVGQKVEENDILAKMETAKALVEIPSPRGGVIAVLHGKAGQAIKVGSPLVTFAAEGKAEVRGQRSEVREQMSEVSSQKSEERSDEAGQERQDAGTVVGNVPLVQGDNGGKVLAAPAVRRLARELGVDLEHVRGTGIGGRITPHDVETAAHERAVGDAGHNGGQTPAPQAPARAELRDAIATEHPVEAGAARIPFRGVRKTIAEHLRRSVDNAVHYTVMEEADVTALDALRRKLMAASNEKITFLPFVAAAVCRVLTGRTRSTAGFARLNSTVDDQRQEIVQHPIVHLGIAADTESGLMVPVIRDAERLGVLELARRISQLAQEARARTLTPDQLSGSTFTISNVGPMGGRFATPIINYPESGILAIGRAREGVVVRDGMIGVGKLLPLSLTADHRVIDGGAAAAALAKIVELLQSPDQLLPPGRDA